MRLRKHESDDTRYTMKITRASIENYRAIDRAELNFHPNMTVIVGKNGAGKTSILEAISQCLIVIHRAVLNRERDHFSVSATTLGDEVARDKSLPSRIVVEISTDGNQADDQLIVGLSTNQSDTDEFYGPMYRYINSHKEVFRHKPLFIYYKQDRSFEAGKSRQASASVDSLSGDLRAISDLEDWWDKRDAQEARLIRDTRNYGHRDIQLQAIRDIVKSIDLFSNIYYSSTATPVGLYFEKDGSPAAHVSQLSSGERSYIILLADLARRLQITSPDSPLDQIPGIVLIDEIELNLHPSWQSIILTTLRQAFSSCQFIVTTHSPQVLSSIRSEHVRAIRREEGGRVLIETPQSTKGRSSNYLLEGVFLSPERDPNIDDMIEEFNSAVDESNHQRASDLFERITKGVDGSPPELIALRKRLRDLGGQT